MDAEPERKPLLRGRGVLRIEDFCRHTGLERAVVEDLLRSGRVRGGLWVDEARTRGYGLFDDGLPTGRELADLGLDVRDDYEPDALRSFEMTDDDDPEAG